MADLYDIDYNKASVQLLPPDKRYIKTVAWVRVLLSPIQWLRDLWFGDYRLGTNAQGWLSTATYNKNDRVVYKQRLYQSLINTNTDLPTVQTSWVQLLDNFIGISERILYTGNKLLFEFAINKYFGTNFRQPNNNSDIYIGVYVKPFNVFIIGAAVSNSSVVYGNNSTGFVINGYNFNTYYNMTINVPVAVFNALDPDPNNARKIITNFANQYLIAGITYTITTY